MCKCPIEFAGLGVDGAEWERTIADASRWNHLGIVPCRENLIGLLEFLIGECLLDYGNATIPQKADYSLPRNAREESAIGNWSEYHAVLRHENIRSSELGDIA